MLLGIYERLIDESFEETNTYPGKFISNLKFQEDIQLLSKENENLKIKIEDLMKLTESY